HMDAWQIPYQFSNVVHKEFIKKLGCASSVSLSTLWAVKGIVSAFTSVLVAVTIIGSSLKVCCSSARIEDGAKRHATMAAAGTHLLSPINFILTSHSLLIRFDNCLRIRQRIMP
ncbi:MAG: hypothetical protein ACUVSA_00040, partial [Desulfosoma sp.]|uniref:hypothetical protein n=1 Tax=Desulfosoma sp. TaxID=2603217 RepID=UPI0040490838